MTVNKEQRHIREGGPEAWSQVALCGEGELWRSMGKLVPGLPQGDKAEERAPCTGLSEQVLGSHSKVCYLLIISFYLEQTKAHPQMLLPTVNQT